MRRGFHSVDELALSQGSEAIDVDDSSRMEVVIHISADSYSGG